MVEHLFAKRLNHIEVSGIRKMFDLVQSMKGVIDLGLGQAHFPTPEPIREAAVRAIREGADRYTVTQGIPELRDRIREDLKRRTGADPGDPLVTSGAAGGLFLACAALVDAGDEVLVPEPYFALYKFLPQFCDGTPVFVDTAPDFRLTPERIERAVTPRTKILIFNNPVNPTGTAYTADEVKAVAAVARKRGFLVLADEVYDRYSHDFPHEPIARHLDRVVSVGAFSKAYAMMGWRVGYATGPRPILEKMATLQQFSFIHAPTVSQKAALAAFDVDLSPILAAYRAKRDRVVAALDPAFGLVRPQGAFFAYPRVPWGTDQEFVEACIRNRVLVVPGRAFSRTRTHLRISYAAEDRDLDRGLAILNRLAREGPGKKEAASKE